MKRITNNSLTMILGIALVADIVYAVRIGRSRRSTNKCVYTYDGICKRNVHDSAKCLLTGFRECYREEKYSCFKHYLDCCESDLMDDGICYSPNDICDDCYTVTDCDGSIIKLTRRQGLINSKNYPRRYEPNQDCTWTIRGPRNSTILIDMIDFRLQGRQNTNECFWNWSTRKEYCRKGCVDWLLIDGGDRNDSPRIQECGTIHSGNFPTFSSTGRTARLHFHTDATVAGRGFQLRYSILGGLDPIIDTTLTTTTSATSIITGDSTVIRPTSEVKICPGKLVWSTCPNCTRTCNNVRQPEEDCLISFSEVEETNVKRCEPGCVCPKQFPIWHELECVTIETCLDDARNIEIEQCSQLGLMKGKCLRTCLNMDQDEEECEKETLENDHFNVSYICVCHPGTFELGGSCVSAQRCQEELTKKCPQNKVWTSCKSGCVRTCTSKGHCSMAKPLAKCTPGCVCPEFAAILHNGECIQQKSCPIDKNIVCGKQFYHPVLKILGGDTAVKGSWPWIVQIEKFVNGAFVLSCGGTLICEKWVLTASHCFLEAGTNRLDKTPVHYRLHVGKHHKQYVLSDEIAGMMKNIIPKRIITHSEYSVRTHVNDIALVEFPKRLRLNRLIRPACIYNRTDFFPKAGSGTTCMSMGWGAETNNEESTKSPKNPELKQVELSPRSHDLCIQIFYHFDIRSMHCVGGHKDRDTCSGDSGGPLMCQRDGRWYVDGIVSYGLKCGVQDQPGVYTRVTHYYEWIRGISGHECGNPNAIWN